MPKNTSHALPRCGGICKDGSKCTQFPIKGRKRCRMHNGNAKRGVEHHSYIHGGYSPYVPIPFLEVYEEMRGDESLANVRDEMALGRMFIAAHLEHLGTVDNSDTLPELLNMLADMKRYYRSSNAAGMANTIDGMERIITDRLEQLKTEDQIMERVEQQRKLVETENKLSLASERAISVEQFMALMAVIFKVIETIVQSKDERIAIATELRKTISIGA